MDKVVDLTMTVYDISQVYPEIIDILKELGFKDIVKPGMLQTAGRFMTIPKGAAMKNISLEHIKLVLGEKGYIVNLDAY